MPSTWHIINNDDAVTRGGKFFVLYKRGGHRVLINKRGDLVVRPSFVEQYIQVRPFTASAGDGTMLPASRGCVSCRCVNVTLTFNFCFS